MDDEFQPPPNFALMAAVFEGGLVVLAVAVGWFVGQYPLESFPRTQTGIARGVAWGAVATLPPLALLWLCLKCPIRPFAELVRVVDELLVPLFRGCRMLELAVICVLAGLGEEMLFRGVVQAAVTDWVGGRLGVWIGLAAAAVLFGLVHRITWTYVLLAGLIGVYLGGIWIVTENLLVPITAHAAYDFLVLVYLVKVRKPLGASRRQTETGTTQDGQDDEPPPDQEVRL